MIFDDSCEHEAWNRGDHVRVVLITDIWQPELAEVERQAVQAVVKTSDDFIRWCHGEEPPARAVMLEVDHPSVASRNIIATTFSAVKGSSSPGHGDSAYAIGPRRLV